MKKLAGSLVSIMFALSLLGTCSTPWGNETSQEAGEPKGIHVFQYQVIAEGGLRTMAQTSREMAKSAVSKTEAMAE